MSSTSEILKSLSSLEENLNDINSAKKQVEKVVKSSEDLARTFEFYKSSFERLSSNVKEILKDSKSFNLDTLKKLSEQTDDLKIEVTRLTKYDFTETFQTIGNKAIDVFEKDLRARLVHVDKIATDIQDKTEEFKTQIIRLESIDLEKETIKQKEIICNISASINTIKQNTDNILQKLKNNQNEIATLLTNCQNEKSKQIAKLEKETDIKFKLMQKEIKTNRSIFIFGIILTMVSIFVTYLLSW